MCLRPTRENGPFEANGHIEPRKLRIGTSKTKQLHPVKLEFSLFWMSQCVARSPARWILYHVTASYKGRIDQLTANTQQTR